MTQPTRQPNLDAPAPLPFSVDRARRIETPQQHMRRIRDESNRSIQTLAIRFGCLGWFDPSHQGPRAA